MTAAEPGRSFAVARAVVGGPKLILADEPTGALDIATGKLVLEALRRINKEIGTTTAVITHNVAIGEMANRVVRLADGAVVEDRRNEHPITPSELSW